MDTVLLDGETQEADGISPGLTPTQVFRKESYEPLKELQRYFHYHFIPADAPIAEVVERTNAEFSYQSSMELSDKTFEAISQIPRATELNRHWRQHLVRCLDTYEVIRHTINCISCSSLSWVTCHYELSGQLMFHFLGFF